MSKSKLSRKQLSAIHAAKRAVGLSDDDYRALLGSFNCASAADLQPSFFLDIMRHFQKLGFDWKGVLPRTRGPERMGSRGRMLLRIGHRLNDLGRGPEYARAIAERMFKVDRLEWLTNQQIRSVLAALERQAGRAAERISDGERN
jgi:phage gp16-like protein